MVNGIVFGGLALFVVGLVMTFAVAVRGRDDARGTKAFRWLGVATLGLLASIGTSIFVMVRYGGLHH